MRTNVTRRTGNLAFIEVSQSRNNNDKLFMSSPPISELTKEQAQALIHMLTTMHREMWGNERGN